MLIAKYKFDSSLYDLIPEFNSGYTGYTYTDEVDGDVTTRTIESNSLPTLMRFGRAWVEGETAIDNRTDSLLEVLDMSTSELTSCNSMFRYCRNLTSITCEWGTSNVTNMYCMFNSCSKLTSLDVSNFDTSNVTNMGYMFYDCNKLTSLDLSNWNTINVTNTGFMFRLCQSLTTLDLSNWDTSKVTDMSYMFRDCNNLTSLDVSNWNTSQVTTMSSMFYNCNQLTSLDVSKWDTSKVTNMNRMFCACRELLNIPVDNWDVRNVTDMTYLFSQISKVTNLNLSNWETNSLELAEGMFATNPELLNISLSDNFDTSKVTNMYRMFYGCSKLTSLDVSNWNTSQVTILEFMFTSSSNLSYLDLSKWDTSQVTNMASMFSNCDNLTTLDLRNWDTQKIETIQYIFSGCSSLKILDISNFTFKDGVNIEAFFSGCNSLEIIKCNNISVINKLSLNYLPEKSSTQGTIVCKQRDLSELDMATLNSKNWTVMNEPILVAKYVFDKSIYNNTIPLFNAEFEGYFIEDVEVNGNEVTRVIESVEMLPTSLQFGQDWTQNIVVSDKSKSLLEVNYVNTDNINIVSNMFRYNTKLRKINCKDWSLGEAFSLSAMFGDCYSLENIDLSKWDTSKIIRTDSMFCNCINLKSVILSNWNVENVANMGDMFIDCSNLEDLYISNWDTSKVTNMGRMFQGCTNLITLDVSNFDMSNVTNTSGMFFNTLQLTDIGMVYCDFETVQKVGELTTAKLWVSPNISMYSYTGQAPYDVYREQTAEIHLNSPLLKGDTIEVVGDRLVHVHRMGMVILDGSEDEVWRMNTGALTEETRPNTRQFMSNIIDGSVCNKHSSSVAGSAFCDKLNFSSVYDKDEEGIQLTLSTYDRIRIGSAIKSLDEFKTWLSQNPTTVVYELAEQWYEDITPLQDKFVVNTLAEGKLQVNTVIPVTMDITYSTDITSVASLQNDIEETRAETTLLNNIADDIING